MEYKLFDDFITLQALLKEKAIIQSGGAIKQYLALNTVLVNKVDEKRRGKKLRIGDTIKLVGEGIIIKIVEPSEDDVKKYKEDLDEKRRVSKRVKEMNRNKKQKNNPSKSKGKVRFPGI